MVYRRRDNKTGKHRPGWTFMARTETGWTGVGRRSGSRHLPTATCTGWGPQP